jgi:6,7-dimethyl-8-ribityllumazine synthase
MPRYDNIPEIERNINGRDLRIGLVMSRFNIDVCEGLLGACTETLLKQGVRPEDITIASVPGALEIPLVLKRMAETHRFDGLVALGAVIRGETYHFEVVSNESSAAVTRVQLDTGIPIANAVLTTNTDEQALERMAEKGSEAALVVIEMINTLKQIHR